MFASKALAERNNDPKPYVHSGFGDGTFRSNKEREVNMGVLYPVRLGHLDPRPEFQHGKLEANPILVEFRRLWSEQIDIAEQAEFWLSEWEYVLEDHGIYATHGQVNHAHRVLTLWLATYGGDK